jgi:hypothetical protein
MVGNAKGSLVLAVSPNLIQEIFPVSAIGTSNRRSSLKGSRRKGFPAMGTNRLRKRLDGFETSGTKDVGKTLVEVLTT